MNILETIIARKKKEVAERRQTVPVAELEKGPYFSRSTASLRESLLNPVKTGIIAEYKRKSPSKGVINNTHNAKEVTEAYAAHGASGISVLTDEAFFGGSLDDLVAARGNAVPLLRKDFTVDEYQILEAKAFGADAVLLIAACLSPGDVKTLSAAAKKLQLDVLLELHDESELDRICPTVDLIGVNNRNLKTFDVNLEHSVWMAEKIGDGFPKVAESGINSVEDIRYLKDRGFQGFLIGEYFMRQPNPMDAFKNFAQAL